MPSRSVASGVDVGTRHDRRCRDDLREFRWINSTVAFELIEPSVEVWIVDLQRHTSSSAGGFPGITEGPERMLHEVIGWQEDVTIELTH